jgi:hypothetical protein
MTNMRKVNMERKTSYFTLMVSIYRATAYRYVEVFYKGYGVGQ